MRNRAKIVVLSVAIPLVSTFMLVPSAFARGGGSMGASHSSFGMGSTVGITNPSRPSGAGTTDPGINLTQPPVPGTSGSPAADSALHAKGAKMFGPSELGSDAAIDAENRKLDRAAGSICRGC